MSDAVKVFVGCAPNGDDAESEAALEHSLRSRSSLPVAITWMKLSRDRLSPFYSDGHGRGWRTELWATPFSGFRWAVPELCRFSGRAIYCDSDVVFLRDVAELWRTPLVAGRVVVAKGGAEKWRFCVSLWDCAGAQQYIPSITKMVADPRAHQRLVAKFGSTPGLVQPFRGVDWNVIDGEDFADLADPRIGALHFSSEAHQPHLAAATARIGAGKHWFVANGGATQPHWRPDVVDVFERELAAAEAAGYTPDKYEPLQGFGSFPMASRKGYGSNRWGKAHAVPHRA